MGEANVAFEWLERAYASHNPRLVEIRSDSVLSTSISIRAGFDPRSKWD